jgi:polyhydroxyalkanoate synthesis regulator phasin
MSPEEANEVVDDLLTSGQLSLAGTLCRKQQLHEKTKEAYIREGRSEIYNF